MIFLCFLLLHSFSSDDVSDVTEFGISQFNYTIVIDYTNTVIFRVTASPLLTVGNTVFTGEDIARPGTYTAFTKIARYMTTIFRLEKMFLSSATAAPQAVVTTPAFKTKFFDPAFLVGVMFGVLFLGGAIWTLKCRKPQYVPVEGGDKDSKEKEKKKKKSSKGKI
jgi:hypothetical protein